MTEKEKEQIAIAGILQDVGCAVEGLKYDAKSVAETFGKVIGAEFFFTGSGTRITAQRPLTTRRPLTWSRCSLC